MDERDAHDAAPASSVSAEAAHSETFEQSPGRLSGQRALARRVRTRLGAGGHVIAPVDALVHRAEAVAQASGQNLDQAAAVIIEDLERDAAALTLRTAPLVPACGILVAVSGLAAKAEPTSHAATEAFVSLAALSAVAGLGFLIRAVFLYAGRRVIGLSPTADDISYARERLVRKHASARRGGSLAAFGLACLIIGILAGVHISIA